MFSECASYALAAGCLSRATPFEMFTPKKHWRDVLGRVCPWVRNQRAGSSWHLWPNSVTNSSQIMRVSSRKTVHHIHSPSFLPMWRNTGRRQNGVKVDPSLAACCLSLSIILPAAHPAAWPTLRQLWHVTVPEAMCGPGESPPSLRMLLSARLFHSSHQELVYFPTHWIRTDLGSCFDF